MLEVQIGAPIASQNNESVYVTQWIHTCMLLSYN